MQDRRRHRRRHGRRSSATRTRTTATRTATSSTAPSSSPSSTASTGKALATVDYLPPRGRVADWGDNYGNRVDRFLAGVAYLDGERPSAVFCRGYYTRAVLVAWDWRDGKLTRRWTFDSNDGNRAYAGQGDHTLSVADVDGDGKDDIVYGACCIGSDGKGLYSTGLGHGDALHVSDLDPERPGLEVFNIHERKPEAGVSFRDAKTGKVIWSKPSPDVGRGLAADIDPRHKGYEFWASGQGLDGVWNAKGEKDLRPQAAVLQLRDLVGRRPAPRTARPHHDHEMELGEGAPRRRC